MGKPSKRLARARPASTCLSTAPDLENHLGEIESFGGTITRDPTAGVVTAADSSGAVVLRAIQKHRSGPWIIMFFNSPSTTWTRSEP